MAAVIAVILAGLTEMTGVVGQALTGDRRYDGPMGKSDRALAYGLLAFLLGLGLGGNWAVFYQWAIVALLAVTVCNRARRTLQT